MGRAMSDLQQMHAEIVSPDNRGGLTLFTGSVPVSELQTYQRDVLNYTGGRGQLSYSLKGYAPCHNAKQVIAALHYDCDGDLENTADSIFCAHGAGFSVKWDRVEEYMHLERALRPTSAKLPAPSPDRRMAAYCATLAEDRELLAIFERTYGPIHKDPRVAFRATPKAVSPPISATRPQRAGPEYLLVDGYNIIFAWKELSLLAKENLDAARQRLTDILCNYQGYCRCELILVFDAYKVKGNPGETEKLHNITVVYTKEAETADMYIEKVTHRLAKDGCVRVATSDGLEQLIILSHGALRVSAAAFELEVRQVETTIRSLL
ncbi:MAG: NYN domain-containing protein [Oscillospiraceae bacterium]